MNYSNNLKTQLAIIGSGPGGYTAAFRAADLGIDVILIEKNPSLGGVCLNRGCIPSKALLHLSHIIDLASNANDFGLEFNKPEIDLNKIIKWKNKIINNLSNGISALANQRNVKIINGHAKFMSANKLIVTDEQKKQLTIDFNNCIIATGSSPNMLNHLYKNNLNIINSTGALDINKIPKDLLVIGGGYIGLELGTVYNSLGSNVTVTEYFSNLLPMADNDLVDPLKKKLIKNFKNIYLSTEVIKLDKKNKKIIATFKNDNKDFNEPFDSVLIAVGRYPNTSNLDLEKAGIQINKNGFIKVNKNRRTIIPNIYAIGDVIGDPMLAHKATHEAKIAAENIAGIKSFFEPLSIPSVIYTNPEVAWVGYTESELKKINKQYNKAIFPWAASGRALTMGESSGKTKILSSKDNSKILGIGIVGHNAGELINEASLAIEMGTSIEDLSLTIHAHPTLSETISNTAEILDGTITDLYIPKK